MRHGRDDEHDQTSNVVSLAGARQHAKASAKAGSGHAGGQLRATAGQWLMSALLVLLAIGGVFALAAPLLRAAGIVGD
jgi:hypothetical protein